MGIHLALLQTDIKFCDFEYNAAHVKEMIADAMEKVPRPDVIVAGSVGIRSEDGMRNTTFLINREGEIVGDYSKMHLYSDMDEDVPYLHGTKTEVYDTELGRVGFMICYDIRFCELSRIYALRGAELLIVTSNFPNPRVSHWRTLLIARAIENQMFVAACNRVGEIHGGMLSLRETMRKES